MILNDEDLILEDFADVWFTNCKDRYKVLKGGRETGKSFNFVGYEPLFKLLSDNRRNIVMIRQNDKDNSRSTYIQLKYAANKLGIAHLFKFRVSPLSIKRISTGQMIIFAGMNDVQNITSTTFEVGYWTDIYFEEFSQVTNPDDFNTVDGSLRVPNDEPDLYCQITICMNAWDVGHWSNEVFFKGYLDDDVETLETEHYQFAHYPDFNLGFGFGLSLHISSFRCNTHASKDKEESMRILKEKNYDYYKVVGLGCWGNVGDVTYPNWSDKLIVDQYKLMNVKFDAITIGIDFGMSNGEGKIKYNEENAKRLGSANTMCLCGILNNWDVIVPIDEYFDSNVGRDDDSKKTAPQIQKEMVDTIIKWREFYNINGPIIAYVDNADSGGFRDSLALEAKRRGLFESQVRFVGCTKIPILSRVYFEDYLFSLGLITPGSNCKNLTREIKNARKTKEGKIREDFDDHEINAFEYAWAPLRQRLRRWKTFKEPI